MAFEPFVHKRFRGRSLQLVDTCNGIMETYTSLGLRLTLRQLFYQLVSRNTIKNSEKTYKNLGQLVSEARLAGLIDWSSIEDRTRFPRQHPEWSNIESLLQSATASYRLPWWNGQRNFVELVVEKDALAGILTPIANDFHVALTVNRGYSSQSAMYEASKRYLQAEEEGQRPVILYVGDHDPSGLDMVRDIGTRLQTFGVDVDVRHLALTTAQVKAHKPPPNPTKVTDSRAKAYIAAHGTTCWEVDALPPDVLQRLIREAIAGLIDKKKMDAIKADEAEDKKTLAGLERHVRLVRRMSHMGDDKDEEE